MTTPLRAARPTAAWLQALRAAVRPEFALDPYIARPGDLILFGTACRAQPCSGPARSQQRSLCSAHERRWEIAGRPDLEDWDPPVINRDRPVNSCAVVACRRSAHGRHCDSHAASVRRLAPEDVAGYERTAPAAGAGLLVAGRCVAPLCGFDSKPYRRGTSPRRFCDAHHARYKQARAERGGDLTVEDYVAHMSVAHLPKYWCSVDVAAGADQPIGEVLRLELQYALQLRKDKDEAAWRTDYHGALVRELAGSGAQSLFDFEDLLDRARPRQGGDAKAAQEELAGVLGAQSRGFVRSAVDALTTLRLRAQGLSEYDRDVWRFAAFGLWPAHEYESCPLVDFRPLPAGWLRDLVKRWAKYAIAQGRRPSTVHGQVRGLHTFARFLREEDVSPDDMAEVDRELLMEYAGWLPTQGKEAGDRRADNTMRREFSALNTWLHAVRLNGWAPELAWNAAYFRGDLSLKQTSLPRFFQGDVLAQMKSEENLSLLPSGTSRAMVETVLETGLRVSDLRRLPLECVYPDHSGNWYLRPFNWKKSREFAIPITGELRAVIRAQRARVVEEFGRDCRWLFPRELKNRRGEHPYAYGQFKQVLGAWCETIELHDEDGALIRVTGHQFRHSVGTLMLNSGMSMEAVRAYLDHDSVLTTAVYAQLLGGTLRKEWDEAQAAIRVNIKGEIIPAPEDAQTETARWLRDHIVTNRTSQAVAHGWCGLPVQQQCPHANACFTCDKFESGPVFLADIKSLFKRTEKTAQQAEDEGRQRMAEMNRRAAGGMANVAKGIEAAVAARRAEEEHEDA